MIIDRSKKILFWLGVLLAVTGVGFVVLRFIKLSNQIDFSQFTTTFWLTILLLSLAYGLISINLATAWRELLAYFNIKTTHSWAIRVYGQTQLAKYLPGNIFHLASRQFLGQSAGIKAAILAKTLIVEHLLLSLIAVLSAILLLPSLTELISIRTAVVVYVVCMIALIVITQCYLSSSIAKAMLFQSAFLIFSGLLFVIILSILRGQPFWSMPDLPLIYGAYILAWLCGMLMPGAPAGVGVRELILSILLNGYFSAGDLTLAVIFSRLVTLSGDVVFFVFSSYLSINTEPDGKN